MKNRARSGNEGAEGDVQSAGGGDFWVTSTTSGQRYLVTAVEGGFQCTCRWAKYRDTRVEPCTHVLAVQAIVDPAGKQMAATQDEQYPESTPQGLDVLNQYEHARALRGAAVKLSQTYGVDLDDVAQEMAITAMKVREAYGFVHVNTIVLQTRSSLTGYNYGVNAYYRGLGVAEVSVDRETDDSEDEWIASFADDSVSSECADVRLSIQQTIETLSEADGTIVRGLMADLSRKEIADLVGIHETGISKRKAKLRGAFAWALD